MKIFFHKGFKTLALFPTWKFQKLSAGKMQDEINLGSVEKVSVWSKQNPFNFDFQFFFFFYITLQYAEQHKIWDASPNALKKFLNV